jgi:hypothetical protein
MKPRLPPVSRCRQTIERPGAALSFRIFSSIHETLETKHEGTLMTGARLKHYGWGREGEGMSAEERKFVLGRYRVKFATDDAAQSQNERRRFNRRVERISIWKRLWIC